MNKKISKIIIITTLIGLLFVPLLGAYYAISYHETKYNEISYNLETEGKIAGTKAQTPTDISNEIPILPLAEIVSVDKSNDKINMTLSTNKTKEEIKSFYDDYFYLNEWTKVDNSTYTKDNKQILIDYIDEVVKLELSLLNRP